MGENIPDLEERWCSWCSERTTHKLYKKNNLSRNEYQCKSCKNFTLVCRSLGCTNMAAHRPEESTTEEDKTVWENLKKNWASEFCAEHNGSIADFEKLHMRLENLEDYKQLLERKKCDLAKVGRIAGGVVVGGALLGPAAIFAGPSIAAALGASGALGAAGTGTAITSLTGAALTSASLAALGPGGMAGGIATITAVGSALGGVRGGIVSNSYFGAIKDFQIIKVREGTGPALIFINGFLSQKNPDASDWMDGTSNQYPNNPCYLVTWESSSLYKLGKLARENVDKFRLFQTVKKTAQKASKAVAGKVAPLAAVTLAFEAADNPFHVAMHKASMTGILLADLIARTKEKDGFILMGHSMGARVIYSLLVTLSTKKSAPVRDVFLLGGAVDRKDTDGWEKAASCVSGHIYNCYSDKDGVLKNLYRAATIAQSSPIGLGPIESSAENIKNCDVSHVIEGHMEYKDKLARILDDIGEKRIGTHILLALAVASGAIALFLKFFWSV